MRASLLLDLTHTSHTRARTGVQRVARSLTAALGDRARPICYDPYLGGWRDLEDWELANLAAGAPEGKRGARWPLRARLRGYARACLRGLAGSKTDAGRLGIEPGGDGLIAPEIFSPEVAEAFIPFLPTIPGRRAAVFHDAIPLKLPDMTPAKTVARFPGYLRELLRFDGIAATSRDSQQTLLEYWRATGEVSHPPVVSIPLGVDLPAFAGNPAGAAAPIPLPPDSGSGPGSPTVLCVGTIEGRKNHTALLDACNELWDRGLRFELRLIGLAQRETGQEALKRIAALKKAGKPLRYDGPLDDAALAEAYRQCAFTVYPSLLEGFGLPVFESLALGRPCVCSAGGALGEAARGGGCLGLPSVDSRSLARAIEFLLKDRLELQRLAGEASARPVRTWADYAREIGDWMPTLCRR
jgi:glycosyltransferase involved in cell wall biosynthesis